MFLIKICSLYISFSNATAILMLPALLLQKTLLFPYICDGDFELKIVIISDSTKRVVVDSWRQGEKVLVNVQKPIISHV